jgi:hypothetical protein
VISQELCQNICQSEIKDPSEQTPAFAAKFAVDAGAFIYQTC